MSAKTGVQPCIQSNYGGSGGTLARPRLMQLAERMAQLGTESAFDGLARAQALEAEGRPIINLGIGAPDFNTPANIVEAGQKALEDGWHFYTLAKGIPQLREAVAADIARNRGVEIDPDLVMIVPGGKPTMFFAMLMLGEAGTEIMYPNPGFPIYQSMIEFTGATPVPIELREDTGFNFDPEVLLANVTDRTRLVIINTPANPTGGVIGRDQLDALVDGLAEHPQVYVLADEIYSRILYGGAEHVSLLGYETIRDRLILLDGWSKAYSMTGWRLGWGLWPATMISGAERLQINSNSCASAPVQVAGIEALVGPQEAVQSMVLAFDERRKFVHESLNSLPGVSCVEPKGAFYAFPNITTTGMTSKEFEHGLLEHADVAVVAGTSFGTLGEGYIRLSYAAGLDQLREAMARMHAFLTHN